VDVYGIIWRGVGSLCDDIADEVFGHRIARHPQRVHGALAKLHAHVDLLPPISHLDEVKGLLLVKRVVDLVVRAEGGRRAAVCCGAEYDHEQALVDRLADDLLNVAATLYVGDEDALAHLLERLLECGRLRVCLTKAKGDEDVGFQSRLARPAREPTRRARGRETVSRTAEACHVTSRLRSKYLVGLCPALAPPSKQHRHADADGKATDTGRNHDHC
jgi:hypothetical protein